MALDAEVSALHVPAREIPVPASVSPQAAAYLARGVQFAPEFPALDDAAGWRAFVAAMDAAMVPRLPYGTGETPAGFTVEEVSTAHATIFKITPPGPDIASRGTYLEIHGGAYIVGGGPACRANGIRDAVKYDMTVWAIDYRMPPDFPFPAGVDDCLDAYRMLLAERGPAEIAIGGVSAGGGLAGSVILRARDEGLPLPAAALLLTPTLDFTRSGDTFSTNLGVDTVLTTAEAPGMLLYAGGADLTHPYLSPLFGDLSAGFPPTILASGTRDLLLSNTVRMHRALRAAGVEAELHVLEAAPHGWFGGSSPEEEDLDKEVSRFLRAHVCA